MVDPFLGKNKVASVFHPKFICSSVATHGQFSYLYIYYLIIKELRFLPKFSFNFFWDNFTLPPNRIIHIVAPIPIQFITFRERNPSVQAARKCASSDTGNREGSKIIRSHLGHVPALVGQDLQIRYHEVRSVQNLHDKLDIL
jgi:hypothetical protein